MKKYLKLLIGLHILVLFSCDKSEFTETKPDMPATVEVDINEDGTVDFTVEYYEVLIESPVSSAGIVARFKPFNDGDEILTQTGEKNLFLRDLDEINENVVGPLSWDDKTYGQTIVSISNNAENNWPTEWEIESDLEASSYFLGLKMTVNNDTELGWVELDINVSNGEVAIINKGIL